MEAPLATPPFGCHCKASAKHENKGDHLVLVEDGRITSVVSLPPWVPGKGYVSHEGADDQSLVSGTCCRVAEAHVQRGDITEDVELEMCMEEACCILPMAALDSFLPLAPYLVGDHEHRDGCGHKQVVHGDHRDWLVPLDDGSYLLTHTKTTDQGGPQLVEHGRLVKVGELMVKKKPSLWEGLFSFKTPQTNAGAGYARLWQEEASNLKHEVDVAQGVENCDDFNKAAGTLLLPGGTDSSRPFPLDEMVYVSVAQDQDKAVLTKTVLNVMAICCPAEDKLIRSLLEPLPGIQEVSVNFTTKTAAVLHDPLLISDGQIVKLLNAANLDASIKQRGELKTSSKWPSPWIVVSAILMGVFLFQYLYNPLKWVALGSVAIGLLPMLKRSVAALRMFILDINVLMAISVVGATAMGDYLEAGGIAFLFGVAMWLESRSVDKARTALASVLSLAPQFAVLLDTGAKVGVEEVKVGTLLAVRAGELIPIDGVVVSGKSCIDESSLTGESLPVEKEPDSTVWAGTVNMSGYLTIRTSALAEDSAVARMVKLVEEAQSARSRTEQYVDKFAKYYTPAVVVAGVLVAVIPAAVGVHNVRRWLYLSLIILVGACPCALVVSTPVTTTCGLARAAKAGLLIKGGSFLEALGSLKCIALDKTGTLTEGHFRVLDVKPVDSHVDLQKLLYWLSAVENKASHPMGAAIVAYARLHGVEPADDVTEFDLLPGEGVTAVVAGHLVRIGNLRLASRLGWHEDPVAAPLLDEWRKKEATVGWIGVEQQLVGVFSLGDEVRPEAAQAVNDLKAAGVIVAMLTGDSEVTAQAVRRQVGDMDVHAELLPDDKVKWVEELKKRGVTGMLGDGINDAPALATADIGIAMGVAGSAVAMETADVALMTNDLTKIAAAVLFGQACRRIIQQNIAFSVATKALVLGLAIAGYAALWAAVVADVGTCLLVTFNGMRLLNWNQFKQGRGNDGRQGGALVGLVRSCLERIGLMKGSSGKEKGGKCDKGCCSPRADKSITGAQSPLLPCCSFDEEMGTVVCLNSSAPQMRRRLAAFKDSSNFAGFQVATSSCCTERCCADKPSPVASVSLQTPSCSKACCGSTPLPVVPAQPEPPPKMDARTGCAKQCCAGKPVVPAAELLQTPISSKAEPAKEAAKEEVNLNGPSHSHGVKKKSPPLSTCSKHCCGPPKLQAEKLGLPSEGSAASVVPDKTKPSGPSDACSKKCCGKQEPDEHAEHAGRRELHYESPAAPSAPKTCSKKCCGKQPGKQEPDEKAEYVGHRELPSESPAAPSPPKTCSKKCFGGQLREPSTQAVVHSSTSHESEEKSSPLSTCSKSCHGPPKLQAGKPDTPSGSLAASVVPEKTNPTGPSDTCSKKCCGKQPAKQEADEEPKNAGRREPPYDSPAARSPPKTCSKKCCGGQLREPSPQAAVHTSSREENSSTTLPEGPNNAAGSSNSCSKKCCGEQQPKPSIDAQGKPAENAINHEREERSSCSKKCCGRAEQPEKAASRCEKRCSDETKPSSRPQSTYSDEPVEEHIGPDRVPSAPLPGSTETCSKKCCGGAQPA